MNHTDINKLIAEIKSVEEEYDILKYIPDIDYINGANSNFGLIEELLDDGWELKKHGCLFRDEIYAWRKYVSVCIENKSLNLATALAYLKMNGVDYEDL